MYGSVVQVSIIFAFFYEKEGGITLFCKERQGHNGVVPKVGKAGLGVLRFYANPRLCPVIRSVACAGCGLHGALGWFLLQI